MTPTTPIGFLNLLKPPGMTSHDVVDVVRRRLPRKTKVGHLGTLDPAATGVLPLAVGSATRLIPWLPNLGSKMKSYHALLRLGLTTSTDDLEGEVLTRSGEPAPPIERVQQELLKFHGTFDQVPPQVSAVRKDGERAYHKARRGETVVLDARPVTLSRCQLLSYRPQEWLATVFMECSSGTYVRSLARDLGEALGVGAALAFLIRTHSGPFRLEQAITLEELRQAPLESFLTACDYPFLELPSVEGLSIVSKGQTLVGEFPKVELFRTPQALLSTSADYRTAKVEALFGGQA